MRRTNVFAIKFKDFDRVIRIADDCAKLWNAINYRRRQLFFTNKFNWDATVEYDLFKPFVGSATTQQIIRKNDQAWRAFFRLLKLKREGRLPNNIQKVSPPGYWKDRNGNRVPRLLIRNDCYKITGRRVKLPFKLTGRIYGNPIWSGKQGTLEIRYDRQKNKWYAYQSVETEPILIPTGNKRAFIDIGVKNILCGYIEDDTQTIVYSGASLLSDWWYWNHEIATTQSKLETVNSKKTSRRLRRLYQTRQKRFRQAINEIVKDFIATCYNRGVCEIVVGDLTNIRANSSKGRKTNAMLNNFWSHKYLTDRLKWTAENLGIKTRLVNERGTSSKCPWCNSTEATKRGRLYKCKSCGVEAHRDAVGALNIGFVHGTFLREGDINRVMAHPLVAIPSHQRNSDHNGIPCL